MCSRIVSLSLLALLGFGSLSAQEKKPVNVRFQKHQLDSKFRSEGIAVADFNKDGKNDLCAGFVWYEAPDWKMHLMIEKEPAYDPKGYSNAFCVFAEDVNQDGWSDVLVVDFPGTPTWWFENPKETGKLWPKHTAIGVTNNESPQYLDVDGDGKKDILCAFNADSKNPDSATRVMGFAKIDADSAKPWNFRAVSAAGAPGTTKYSHGLGCGDINKDGKLDILSMEGWWEAPASPSESGEWKFHAAQFGQGANYQTFDYDGDGDTDVITTSPHGFGIWWHEQLPEGKWAKHEIDKSFSQTHATAQVDLNGDGLPDLITGKRWWAHAKGDPGGDDPAVFTWFELTRENGRPVWIPHQFDHDSGVGTQFEVADVDGDKLLDIVASSKKGVHFFKQLRD